MNKRLIVSVALSIALPAFANPLTQGERERAMSELHATRKQFLDSVAGLSDAQWSFKPAPEVWSVAEVAEHIAVSEDTILKLVTDQVMKTPAAPGKKPEVQGKDRLVLEKAVDRSMKFKAPEMLQPTRRWPHK